MAIFQQDKQALISSHLRKLTENTNITQLTPGGKARFFIETADEELNNLHGLFNENILQIYIQYCEDKFLDFFGDMFNNPRLEATHAVSENNNFMFYLDSGVFGDLNNGNNFLINAGEIISTQPFTGQLITPGLETQPVIEYTVLEDIICRADQSFVYGSVRANIEGKASSVPRNTLTKHNITQLGTSLKCTNRYSIDNGDERESNESYRYRLLQVFKSREKATKVAVRLAALSVPGVSNILMVSAEQGPGTSTIYVKGITSTVSPALLNTVSEVVQSVSAEGIRFYILSPRITGMDFVLVPNWSRNTTEDQKQEQYRNMRNRLEEILNETEIGEPVYLSDLIQDILTVAPNVLSIGKQKPNTFEEVYLYRESPDGIGYIRTKMIGDYIEPLYNERMILETSNSYRGIQFII